MRYADFPEPQQAIDAFEKVYDGMTFWHTYAIMWPHVVGPFKFVGPFMRYKDTLEYVGPKAGLDESLCFKFRYSDGTVGTGFATDWNFDSSRRYNHNYCFASEVQAKAYAFDAARWWLAHEDEQARETKRREAFRFILNRSIGTNRPLG